MSFRPHRSARAALALIATPLFTLSFPVLAFAQTADWTKTVVQTPEGGFLLGNPDARTKIVEYMSYSCPHCAAFAHEAGALKADWIRRGLVSIEYRNFVRDPFDLSAALIARCGGAGRFLATHELIFSSFDAWIAKAGSYKAPATPEGAQPDRTAQLIDIAGKVGLADLAARNGLGKAAVDKCLASEDAINTLLAMRADVIEKHPDFSGTPSFFVNGKLLSGVHGWAALKPLLPALPASGN